MNRNQESGFGGQDSDNRADSHVSAPNPESRTLPPDTKADDQTPWQLYLGVICVEIAVWLMLFIVGRYLGPPGA